MKRTRIVMGVALALASTAAMAVSGERWYGTNSPVVRDPIVVERVVVPEREYVYPEREIVYAERYALPAPVVVERSYVARPGYVVVRNYAHDPVKALNPETGHYIDRGLFNRTGPNDFGS